MSCPLCPTGCRILWTHFVVPLKRSSPPTQLLLIVCVRSRRFWMLAGNSQDFCVVTFHSCASCSPSQVPAWCHACPGLPSLSHCLPPALSAHRKFCFLKVLLLNLQSVNLENGCVWETFFYSQPFFLKQSYRGKERHKGPTSIGSLFKWPQWQGWVRPKLGAKELHPGSLCGYRALESSSVYFPGVYAGSWIWKFSS